MAAPAAPAAPKSPMMIGADTGEIRPMSLGPQVETQDRHPLRPMTSGGGGTSGGGNSGGYGDPPAPYISGLSAQGQGQFNGPDQPVGAIVTFSVVAPTGWQIDPASVNWSGGTDYKSYFSDPPQTTVSDDPSLQAVSLQTGVNTHAMTYTFILGAEQQQYSIEVNCGYIDPVGGEDIAAPPTTVTFNAVRPTMATISGAGGFQVFWTTSAQAILAYSSNNQPWANNNQGPGFGNVITAWTQTVNSAETLCFCS